SPRCRENGKLAWHRRLSRASGIRSATGDAPLEIPLPACGERVAPKAGSVRRVLQKERAKESPVNSSRQTKTDRRESMAPKKTNANKIDWKSELMAGGDVVRELFRDVLQEVLEAEMTE